jgi:hypothetical protein
MGPDREPRRSSQQSVLRRVRKLLARHEWVVLSCLALAAVTLGYLGFRDYYRGSPVVRHRSDFFYLALQLFTLESGSSALGPKPWTLEVARLLAPLVAMSAAVRALLGLAHERYQAVRLRFADQHVIVCGLGTMGMRLVEEFRAEGRDVIVIEQRADHPLIARCRSVGAIVVLGNAASRRVLAQARVWAAESLYAVTQVDTVDLDIALAAYEVAAEHGGCSLRCAVHVVDARLSDELKRHRSYTDPETRIELWPFNVYELAARQHFAEHPLDPTRLADGGYRGAHLMLVGCDRTGEAFALQGARIGHFASGRPLKITVFDRLADLRRRQLEARYPRLADAAEWSFETLDVDTVEFVSALDVSKVSEDDDLTIIVCLESEAHSLACAAALGERLMGRRAAIYVCVWGEGSLGALMAEPSAPGRPRVDIVSVTHLTCRTSVVEKGSVDDLACGLHEAYLEEQARTSPPGADRPALRPWALLPQAFRDSNRQEADHLPVKLRAVGCVLHDLAADAAGGGGERVTAFAPGEVETLAAMEHARWCAERYLAGWRYGEPKDVPRKIHPLLRGWSDIPEEARAYNRTATARLPALLEKLGRGIYRVTTSSE